MQLSDFPMKRVSDEFFNFPNGWVVDRPWKHRVSKVNSTRLVTIRHLQITSGSQGCFSNACRIIITWKMIGGDCTGCCNKQADVGILLEKQGGLRIATKIYA